MRRPANQRPSFGRRPNAERIAKAVAFYAAGLSTVEIARRLSSTPTNILLALRGAGVAIRSPSESIVMGKRRRARYKLIEDAARRQFGHVCVGVAPPIALPPVNDLFMDDAFESWESEW